MSSGVLPNILKHIGSFFKSNWKLESLNYEIGSKFLWLKEYNLIVPSLNPRAKIYKFWAKQIELIW